MDFSFMRTFYCSLCDYHFPDMEARANHLRYAPNHPKCDKCDLYFANLNSLRNHFVVSRRHHFCPVCDIHFKSAAGFRAHLELSSIHCDDEDGDDLSPEEAAGDSHEGWEDEVGARLFPEEDDDYDELPVSLDDRINPEDEYWPEDDEPAPEDDSYNGWAPVPAEFKRKDEAPKPDASSHSHEGLDCSICLEKVIEPTSIRCGHMFCGECIQEALDVQTTCPVCRTDATWRQMRQVIVDTIEV